MFPHISTEVYLVGGKYMSAQKQKNPPWFYVVLALQCIAILIFIGMMRDLMWIL